MTAHSPQVPQTPAEADPRRWVALLVLLLANFMNLIDVTIVNVALPSLQQGLGASSTHIEWVVAGYVLAFAVGLLPFGRLGDIMGRKQIFLLGVGAFTLASALCGLAPNIETLIAARVLQGVGGAIMTPQVLAIVQLTFPPQEKGVAFSLFGLVAGLASVTGPLLGGLLISADLWGLGWRPIFLVNIPIGIATIIAGNLLIRRTEGHSDMRNDFVGIGIFGVTILLLIFPLIEGRAFDWPLWTFLMMAASLLGMAAFYLWQRQRERRGEPQLLAAHLLQNGNFLLGAATTIIFFSGMPGFFMVLAIFLQTGFGFTPLESGLTTVPFPLGVLMASFISGRLGSRFLKQRLAGGALTSALGMVLVRMVISGVGESVDHWWLALPLGISGLGLGLAISGLFQTILSGIPPREAGSGSGALQAFQQVGGALGVALMGQIFFSTLAARMADPRGPYAAFVEAASSALVYEIAVFLVVAALVPFIKSRPQAAAGQVAEPQAAEV